MPDILISLTASLIIGMLLGAFYFGTLWFTIQRLAASEHPMRTLILSYVGRLFVTLGCFYFLIQGHWSRLAVALLGFAVMRGLLIRRWALPEDKVDAS